MKTFKYAAAVSALAVAMVAGPAQAGVPLLDSSMYPTLVGTNLGVINGVTFQSAAGDFIVGSNSGFSGLGVTDGRTNTEIDIGETITMSWADAVALESFSLSLLYNGPEFNDVLEVAQVTAYDSGGATLAVGTLTVSGGSTTTAVWSLSGVVTNLSPADQPGGGSWLVSNPFGALGVNKLEFTALLGAGCDEGACTNESDFVLSTVTAVPEPETYALMLAGLAAVGFMVRRRRPQA